MDAYQEIFEKIPDGVTLHDAADGAILETNEQFCEMLGYSRGELLQLDFEALHVDEPPYTSERAEQYIRKAATAGPQTFEWVDETNSGERLPVEVHLRQTAIDGDQRILAVVRDITERRHRERALERKNERLEEFARVVSHDLRNPLNVLGMSLELVEETGDPEEFDRCRRAVGRMEQLIDDLLALAREGERISEMEPVDLAESAEGCWGNVDTGTASLSVRTDRHVRADESRLRQLLANLFRNATTHGGPDGTVVVGDLEGERGFFVADDGPGIPASERERVLEAGYSAADGGTGFGLAIVERIVEAHGWELRLAQSAAGGARFEIAGTDGADSRVEG